MGSKGLAVRQVRNNSLHTSTVAVLALENIGEKGRHSLRLQAIRAKTSLKFVGRLRVAGSYIEDALTHDLLRLLTYLRGTV